MSRVVVIDDEVSFTKILAMNLEATGHHEVCCLNDPTNALDVTVEWKPDVILLDMVMPQMSGEDIFAQLRGHEDLKETPILLLSASDCSNSIVQGDRVEHLPKPMSTDTILKSIDKLIEISQPPEPAKN